MMKRLRNLPIQKKMLAMTLLICGAVLVVAIAAFFVFQVLNFRTNFQQDYSTLAVIIANNSTAAMAFSDKDAADEVLNSLKANSTILSATLTTETGALFAHFGTPEDLQTLAQFPPPGKSRFTGKHLLLTQPVVWKGEQKGMLYLRTDYQRTFLELLSFYGRVIVGILVGSISLAIFLSSRLGRTITDPVLALAQTAKVIGQNQDYSVRATVSSQGDELGQLAESFNEMLSRIQNQDAALSLSQQKMEALIHSIDGIVWEREPETFRFTFVSRQSEQILGYAPETWLKNPHFWEEKLFPQDAAKAVQSGHEMAQKGQPYSHEYRMVAHDGGTVWIRESGTVLIEKGRAVALRGIFQDITQHKLDVEQLDKLNRQLIDTSRHAGMADVATGVLHNVGNVLNSVSVSANLVGDRLRGSNVGDLKRATTMLLDQNGRLADFLTTDSKGKLLPEFLNSVAEELVEEQAALMDEMNSVGQHIEHIKEIVAMQQSYAKVSGVYENLSAAELVEDALRMNVAAFERHQINLIREFDAVTPAVCVDRHKVLQILINILRNAKHAMEDLDGQERCMTIRVGMKSPDRVEISVRDNGIGIPAENLTKIFNHGFTTKQDGHGFGLHSGANAARQMGGSLRAHSDGPGSGAEFTLELPTSVAAAKERNLATEGTNE